MAASMPIAPERIAEPAAATGTASQKLDFRSGNEAAALAATHVGYHLMGYFPITPSTKYIETVAAQISQQVGGKKRVKLMEAEHAVADYLVGAAATCRDLIFPTATSSVGLDHMTETTRSLGASGLGNVLLIDDRTDSGWTLTVAARLLRRAGAGAVYPFVLGIGEPVQIGASVGIATAGQGTDVAGLVRAADIAMYQAKARGRGQVVSYLDGMEASGSAVPRLRVAG